MGKKVEKKIPSDQSVTVEIECVDGKKLSKTVLHPAGTPQFPLSWSELEDKYRQCVSPILSNDSVDKTISIIKNFEKLNQISSLAKFFGKSS
jgi:2-methylcitrate dehydratase PrpD